MKKKNRSAGHSGIWLCILALAFVFGCDRDKGQGAGAMMMAAPEVEVCSVAERMLLPQVELPGRTNAFRTAEVRPQVSGILQKRLFTEGAEVKEGQVLYQIDPAIYQATLASAEAALAQAQAAENSARQKAVRYQALVKSKAVSSQEQVDADAAWKQAKAGIAAAKAALETARINLNYTRVKAPISGRIGKSMVTEGALLTAQQGNALAVIQQIDPIYVDVNQPAADMLRLRDTMEANKEQGATGPTRVQVISSDGTPYGNEGSLEFSDVTVDEGTGTVTVRAVVPNPERNLLPGMFIRARMTSPVEVPTLLVPQAALSRTQRGEVMVYVVDNDGKAQIREIVTGRNDGQDVVVTKGLIAGDRVIVNGLQRVRPDAPVKIVDKVPAPAAQNPGGAPQKAE